MPILLNISSPSGKPAAGSSRFWGRPDLPYGSDYPFYTGTDGNEYPYVFICQINLAEIAEYDTGNLLPHEGLLSFFARIDHYLGDFSAPDGIGGYVSGRDAVRVMYIPSCANLEEVPLPDDCRSCPVTPGEMQIVFGAGEPDASLCTVSGKRGTILLRTGRYCFRWIPLRERISTFALWMKACLIS